MAYNEKLASKIRERFAGLPNVEEKEIDYVLGSGIRARTYLHLDEQKKLVELPVGWYAEKGGYWGMNPGYDRPDQPDFRRRISQDLWRGQRS